MNSYTTFPDASAHSVDVSRSTDTGSETSSLAPNVTNPQTWNDAGNAERLIGRFGDDMRYVSAWKSWLVWVGDRWMPDDNGRVTQFAITTLREMYAYLPDIADSTSREGLFKFINGSLRRARIQAMIALAATQPGITVRPSDLDADPMLFNTLSGTLDLRTFTLKSHDPADLITKLAPVEYHEDVKDDAVPAPVWDAFLVKVQPNPEMRAFLLRAAGYSLMGADPERAFFDNVGRGRNGKTKFLNALEDVFGDYAKHARAETFTKSKRNGNGHSEDIARLEGARLVTASETEEGAKLAEAVIKEMTGGDTQTARSMFKGSMQFQPQWSIWVGTNHYPVISGTDDGIWDRIKVIPWPVRIEEHEIDTQLGDKLKAERNGIFRRLLNGLREYQRIGLAVPTQVKAATTEYREEMDVLAPFLTSHTEVAPGAKVRRDDLYTTYRTWCEQNRESPLDKPMFTNHLRNRNLVVKPGTANKLTVFDLALKVQGEAA